MERLKTMLDDLNSASRRALLSMGTIDESIGKEERNDMDFRVRYPQYTGNSSKIALSDIRSNNLRMREAYDNAQASDKQIEKELHSTLITNESFNLIFSSKQDVAKVLSSVKVTVAAGMEPNLLDLDYHEGGGGGGGGDEGGSSKKIDTTLLEEKLHDMADVVESRDKLVKALKEIVDINITEISSNIISSSTYVNYLDAITAVHKENLEKAHSIDDEINKGLSVQEQILSEIIKLNDVFVKARDHNPIEVEKSRVIAGIDEHITKYMSMHAQMTAGFTFYSGLQVVVSC
jgi:flagellar hook-associated protein FlgK